MLKDKYGQIIYSEKDLVELYLANPDLVFSRTILSDSNIPFEQDLNIDTSPMIVK